jgi:hypothetical protein
LANNLILTSQLAQASDLQESAYIAEYYINLTSECFYMYLRAIATVECWPKLAIGHGYGALKVADFV